MEAIKICVICERDYITTKKRTKYCSDCRKKKRKEIRRKYNKKYYDAKKNKRSIFVINFD